MNWCKFRQAVAYTPKLVVISSTYQLYNLSWLLFSMYGSLKSLSGNLTFLILNWMWGCFVASPIQSFTVRPAPICRIDGLVWSNGCSEVNAILVFFDWWLGGWAIMYFQVGVKTMLKGWNVVIWPDHWWGHSSHCLNCFQHRHSSSGTCCCQLSCSWWQQAQFEPSTQICWHRIVVTSWRPEKMPDSTQRESGSRDVLWIGSSAFPSLEIVSLQFCLAPGKRKYETLLSPNVATEAFQISRGGN